MKYRELGNTGLKVSVLSYGASSLGSVFRNIDEQEGILTVRKAVDYGINLLDVSPYYGLTKAEKVLGKALKEIPREDVILSTKAGRYGDEDFDFTASRIKRSVEESLSRLGTDYIDILHLHDIEFGSLDQIIHESIPALMKLKQEGKIRFYGISGLPLNIFNRVLNEIHVDTILSYCHYSLNNSGLLSIEDLLRAKGVGVINASPLSMGLLSQRGTPDWHPATEEIKEICKKAVQFCKDNDEDIAKLAIQFSVSNDNIPTTLVGTANPMNLEKNIRWIQEPINKDLLNRVREILGPIQHKMWKSGREENN